MKVFKLKRLNLSCRKARKAIKQNYSHYRKELVDEVEAESAAIKVTNMLTTLFPLRNHNVPESKDFVHLVLARVLRDVVWLGWVSEAKCRRGAYNRNAVNFLRDSIMDSFEVGREYAKERK